MGCFPLGADNSAPRVHTLDVSISFTGPFLGSAREPGLAGSSFGKGAEVQVAGWCWVSSLRAGLPRIGQQSGAMVDDLRVMACHCRLGLPCSAGFAPVACCRLACGARYLRVVGFLGQHHQVAAVPVFIYGARNPRRPERWVNTRGFEGGSGSLSSGQLQPDQTL